MPAVFAHRAKSGNRNSKQSALARDAFRLKLLFVGAFLDLRIEMAGVLQEVKHPQLKVLLAKDVISFRTKYLAYERRISELNSQRPVAQRIKPTELSFSIVFFQQL